MLLTFLLCLNFTLAYSSEVPYLNLAQYTAGQAPTPYQYRVLPMLVLRFVAPLNISGKLAAHFPLGNPGNVRYLLVLSGLVLVSILTAVFSTRATLRRLTGDPLFSNWMCLLVVYMAYFNLAPGWGLNYTFPYDVPSLALFCVSIFLIVSDRLLLFDIVLILATLTRETSCFLILFFVIWQWYRVDPLSSASGASETGRNKVRWFARVAPHVLVQAAIWLGLKLYLAKIYGPANAVPGAHAFFKSDLRNNLIELAKPQQWPVFFSVCGFLLPVLWAGRRWIRNRGIAAACAIILPVWFAGMLIVGIVEEIRIFSEWTAFVVPALALIVHNRFRPLAANLEDLRA